MAGCSECLCYHAHLDGEMVTSPVDPTSKYYSLPQHESTRLVCGYVRSMLLHYLPHELIMLLFRFYWECLPAFMTAGQGTVDYTRMRVTREFEPDVPKIKTYVYEYMMTSVCDKPR